MSQLFAWGGQSTGVSALASFLPKNIQDWSPSGWTGWISLQSKGLKSLLQHHSSKASIFWHSAFFKSNFHIHTWLPLDHPREPGFNTLLSHSLFPPAILANSWRFSHYFWIAYQVFPFLVTVFTYFTFENFEGSEFWWSLGSITSHLMHLGSIWASTSQSQYSGSHVYPNPHPMFP